MKSESEVLHFLFSPANQWLAQGRGFVHRPSPGPRPYAFSYTDYVANPFHRVYWSMGLTSGENAEFHDSMTMLVESGEDYIPFAYLLVQQRLLTPGNVLEMLARSSCVTPNMVSKRSLNVMLDGWEFNLRADYREPKPLVAARPIDIGGAGSDIYIDSDPITEELVSPLLYSATSRAGMPVAAIRAMIRGLSASVPGEVHAAGLARTGRIRHKDWWRFGGYTRGTLRQVFAALLSTKVLVGPTPPDAVGRGLHTDEDWAF